jgi:hypothetical protein
MPAVQRSANAVTHLQVYTLQAFRRRTPNAKQTNHAMPKLNFSFVFLSELPQHVFTNAQYAKPP